MSTTVEIDEEESDGTSLSEPTDEYLCDIVRTHFQIDLKSFDEYEKEEDTEQKEEDEEQRQKRRYRCSCRHHDFPMDDENVKPVRNGTYGRNRTVLGRVECKRIEIIIEEKKVQLKNALDGLKNCGRARRITRSNHRYARSFES